MVYVIPICTLPVRISKIPFSQDSPVQEAKVRKTYFVPFEPIEWLENLHMTRKDLKLGKFAPNSLYVFWSVFYSQIQFLEVREIFAPEIVGPVLDLRGT